MEQDLQQSLPISSLINSSLFEAKLSRLKHSRTDMQKKVTAISNEFYMSKQMTGSLFKYLQFQANLTFDEIDECVSKARTWKVAADIQSKWLWTLLKQKAQEIKMRNL